MKTYNEYVSRGEVVTSILFVEPYPTSLKEFYDRIDELDSEEDFTREDIFSAKLFLKISNFPKFGVVKEGDRVTWESWSGKPWYGEVIRVIPATLHEHEKYVIKAEKTNGARTFYPYEISAADETLRKV